MFPVKSALLAATMMTGAIGLAVAQTTPPTYDPAQLPQVKGKVAQYTLTPRGDVDGLILADGTEVHVNPRLSNQLVFAVKPGDSVTIHGLKARALPMVAAASVTNDATNVTISGEGMRGRRDATQLTETGTVKEVLHDPRGAVNGVLLSDSTVIRLPPPEARRLADTLAVGKTLTARGVGVSSPLGKVVLAQAIGTDPNNLTQVMTPHHRGGMFGRNDRRGPPPSPPGAAPPPPAPAQ